MKQLIIVLPIIISLLALSGILVLQKTPEILSYPVNFQQYDECYKTNIHLLSNCNSDKDFEQAYLQFYEKTYQSTNTPQCQQYQQYRDSSEPWYTINFRNSYSDCFLDPQIAAIANTSSCFLTNYYYPIVLGCGGF